ncbi:MAG TPA: TIM-barrel domain-containing protein [Pyrinomonadaceae bacterium]|jgi:alpha-glucosidase|nr:TIM-barrel domain-containing protein [Pyrinomonadaceae bacterium]
MILCVQNLNARRQLRAFAFALLCALTIAASEARAAWRGAGDVSAVAREANGVTLTLSSGARASVTLFDLDVVRVRLAPRGAFERDHSYAVWSRDRKTVAALIKETRDAVEITPRGVEGAKIIIRRRPFTVTVLDVRGNVVVEDDAARPVSFDTENGAIEAAKRRDDLEFYYGFGEKALPTSRQGQVLVNWNTDTYAYAPGVDPIYQSVPFFIALRQGLAYGLFFDNTYRTHFDMGRTAPNRYTFGAAGGELNYYVFTGGRERTPQKVLGDYTELTGRMPLPPLWSLGYQQSRWSYYPEAKVREIARGFRARKIPADVIYLDIDYMDGYRVFTWDKSRFPDPPRMLRDLSADGFRTVLIVDPGIKVDENYSAYVQGRAAGFFHQTKDGREFQAKVWPGICAFPDFTNPQARAWFGSLYKRHLDEGVSGFWNDMNEPATFPPDTRPPQPSVMHDPAKTFPLDVRHDGDGAPGDHARYHNTYGMQMARATFEGLRNLRPDARPFVLTRAGYAGVQRFAAVWTGDNVPSWEHLQLSLAMLTNMSVSGLPFVGADVGGFAGNASAELYTRWLQAAALTPFYRSHVAADLQEREPWSFGEANERINRASIELRYQLLPYIYTLFREHEQTGMPVMRPLWFNYPADYNTYAPALEQFLVGRDLLVAPVLTQGDVKRPVYFPKGDAWVDWWTGARYEGGTSAEIDAPLSRLPLFARAGAIIPVQPAVQHTGEMARAPLSVVVVSGATPEGEGRIHQDAGDGYGYRRSAWRTTTVTRTGERIRFKHVGDFREARPVRFVEVLGLDDRPKEIRIDGREAKNVSFARDGRRLRVPLPEDGASEITLVP